MDLRWKNVRRGLLPCGRLLDSLENDPAGRRYEEGFYPWGDTVIAWRLSQPIGQNPDG